MGTPVFTNLEGHVPILRHEHVAVLYRSGPATYRLVPFIAEGLEQGDLCQVVAPTGFQAELVKRLRDQVGDVNRYVQSGLLRLHPGLGDFRELRKLSKQVYAAAEDARRPGLRWLEETSWPPFVGLSMPQFFEFHAMLNYQVKVYPGVVMCQFALDKIEIHHLFSAIAVHRHLLIDDTLVRDNPFYMPPEKYIPASLEDREHDLAQLFREVGFDVDQLLAAIVGYGRL
ncbi:MAG TPA: MEDS domain-containing protein [Terriglobia bacterium]|nr:MEDS domain-containing protein [Terriglobia bacterium]